MCELTPKISWTTTSPPRALPLGAARYAPNLNPSSDVRLIISPIVVLSSSWWSAWNERGATARRIHGQREAIEHVTPEEAVDIGQADVVHDHRQRPHAGAGHVEQWHRDLARRRRARHADDVHDAGAAGVEPGPCDGDRDDRRIGGGRLGAARLLGASLGAVDLARTLPVLRRNRLAVVRVAGDTLGVGPLIDLGGRRHRRREEDDDDGGHHHSHPRSGSTRRPSLKRLVKLAVQMTSASSTIWSSLKCLRNSSSARSRMGAAPRVSRSAKRITAFSRSSKSGLRS